MFNLKFSRALVELESLMRQSREMVSHTFIGDRLFCHTDTVVLSFCYCQGFGDFVPSQGLKTGSEASSIAQCSLYLLFGIALLAMSFNLVQEEVIANVKGIAGRLGILKEEEIND